MNEWHVYDIVAWFFLCGSNYISMALVGKGGTLALGSNTLTRFKVWLDTEKWNNIFAGRKALIFIL